jgi:GT2 family glycosyltransferase
MTVVLAIPTLNRFDMLERAIDTALAGTVAPDHILVVDNSGGQCPRREGVTYFTPDRNLGVARSWNLLAEQAFWDEAAQLILSNDDIAFAPDTIQVLLAAATPEAAIVSTLGGLRYCLFWLSRAAYTAIGPFDEQFYPGCFEDNDWDYRARLLGWERLVAPSNIEHEHSATMKALVEAGRGDAWHAQFRVNAARYRAKWGNLPGRERYTVEYGGVGRE